MKQQDFKRFVQTYIYRHSSLQAIAWLPRTIMKNRSNRRTPIQITEKTQQGKIVSARQRAEYFPVYYNVSFKEKDSLSGFDFASNPVYKAALQRAVDNDEIVVTGKVESI
jgi:CHASE1-domain containing sensor protein